MAPEILSQASEDLSNPEQSTSLKLRYKAWLRVDSLKGGFLSGLFFFFFLLFRAAPEAYKGSQARGGIRATAANTPQQQPSAMSATYTTAHGDARSSTH